MKMRKTDLPAHHEYQRYSKALKNKVIREYQGTGQSIQYLQKKYEIRSSSTVFYWINGKVTNKRVTYLSAKKRPIEMSKPKTDDSQEVRNLKQRIRQLERDLEDARLLSEAYSLMIRKAEEELNIPIRKKRNTK
jgi:transposase-like protein